MCVCDFVCGFFRTPPPSFSRENNQSYSLEKKSVASHNLDLLGLCELGQHRTGLHGREHFDASDQQQLMELVVAKANAGLARRKPQKRVGAAEPDPKKAVGAQEPDLLLLSADIPSYAVIKRATSNFQVDTIRHERDLDPRPNRQNPRPERHMVVCTGRWDQRQINIGLCHCPSSGNWNWDGNARAAVIPEILERIGARRDGNGVAEPVAWILGGDLNCGACFLSEVVKDYQPFRDCGDLQNVRGKFIQQILSHAIRVERGDIAIVQHLQAFQISTSVGKNFGGVSDAHDLVVVPVRWPQPIVSDPVLWPQPDVATHRGTRSGSSHEILPKQHASASSSKSAGAAEPGGVVPVCLPQPVVAVPVLWPQPDVATHR